MTKLTASGEKPIKRLLVPAPHQQPSTPAASQYFKQNLRVLQRSHQHDRDPAILPRPRGIVHHHFTAHLVMLPREPDVFLQPVKQLVIVLLGLPGVVAVVLNHQQRLGDHRATRHAGNGQQELPRVRVGEIWGCSVCYLENDAEGRVGVAVVPVPAVGAEVGEGVRV